MAAPVVFVIDTSSVCAVRRLPKTEQPIIFNRLAKLVQEGRLVYPPEVVDELERGVEAKGQSDKQYEWAAENQSQATPPAKCTFEEVKAVLAEVPDVLDHFKDSGAEEADPYVLAAALKLKGQGLDARIVTQETKD